MSSQLDSMDGYVRAHAGLRLLDSSTTVSSPNIECGQLNLFTEDGCLALEITASCAEDLIIDLQNFLKVTSCIT